MKNGALQTFGVEAAIVIALFFLIVPPLQLKGAALRVSASRRTRFKAADECLAL